MKKHVIAIANDLVINIGNAKIHLTDKDGITLEATFCSFLYISSFSQDIFSVQEAIENGG